MLTVIAVKPVIVDTTDEANVADRAEMADKTDINRGFR